MEELHLQKGQVLAGQQEPHKPPLPTQGQAPGPACTRTPGAALPEGEGEGTGRLCKGGEQSTGSCISEPQSEVNGSLGGTGRKTQGRKQSPGGVALGPLGV